MIFSNSILPFVLALGSADPEVRLQGARHIVRLLSVPGQFDTIGRNRLIPLIYQALTGFRREDLGEVPFLEELRQGYLWALRSYTVQERETRQLVSVLSDAGVEVILLKGADIRHRLYDDPATRLMGDVDVLIAPAQMNRARTALEGQGYRLHLWDLDPQPGFNERFDYDISYISPSGALPCIDLHWEIREVGTFYRLPYAPLRAGARARDLEGVPALVLSPEHVLMHLCLHTFDEMETAGMLKLVDLDRALSRLPLDWELFLADTATFHIEGPVGWLFREIERLRPGAVPDAVLERLGAHHPNWAERFILRRGALALSVASMMALWRYLPIKAWPAYLKGKLWPSAAYLRANVQEYGSRSGYLRHLLLRAKAKT